MGSFLLLLAPQSEPGQSRRDPRAGAAEGCAPPAGSNPPPPHAEAAAALSLRGAAASRAEGGSLSAGAGGARSDPDRPSPTPPPPPGLLRRHGKALVVTRRGFVEGLSVSNAVRRPDGCPRST